MLSFIPGKKINFQNGSSKNDKKETAPAKPKGEKKNIKYSFCCDTQLSSIIKELKQLREPAG